MLSRRFVLFQSRERNFGNYFNEGEIINNTDLMIDLRDIGFVLNDGPPLSNTYKIEMISDVKMFS